MASIVWADVTAHPGTPSEFSAVSPQAQADILALVNRALPPAEWGEEDHPRLRLGRIFLAAHYASLELRRSTGPAGPVVSESAGGLSRSYAQPGGLHVFYGATPYGLAFQALCASGPARGPRVF